jgi:hypothetical protein
MLDKVKTYETRINALTEASDCIIGIGQHRGLRSVNCKTIEKLKASRTGLQICAITARVGRFRHRERGSKALQIERCGVTRAVGLVIVDESPCFFLLIFEDPIRDLKYQYGEIGIMLHLPPTTERLHEP